MDLMKYWLIDGTVSVRLLFCFVLLKGVESFRKELLNTFEGWLSYLCKGKFAGPTICWSLREVDGYT